MASEIEAIELGEIPVNFKAAPSGKGNHADSASQSEENNQPAGGGDNVDGYQAMNTVESETDDDDSNVHTKLKKYFVYRVRRKSQGGEPIHTKWALADFVEQSSSQVAKLIHHAPGGLKRIFWVTVFVASLVALTLHLHRHISRYLLFETTTDTQVLSEPSIPFPAVTICNNNMLRRNKQTLRLRSSDGQDQTPNNSKDELIRPPPPLIYSGEPGTPDTETDFAKFKPSDGHQLSDLIISARFANKKLPIDEDHFLLVENPYYGNCFTFNMDGTHITHQKGEKEGLDLVLNIEEDQYLTGDTMIKPAEWVGAIVKVHPYDQVPMPETGGVRLEPNTQTKILLKRSKLIRIPDEERYGKCYKDSQVYDHPDLLLSKHGYSKFECQRSCLQKMIVKDCCCHVEHFNFDTSLLNLGKTWNTQEGTCDINNVRACNDSQSCWKEIWNRHNGVPQCEDVCWDTCNQTMYDLQTDRVLWPSKKYMGVLLSELNGEDRSDNAGGMPGSMEDESKQNITESFVRENYLSVQVYYGSMTSVYQKRVPRVDDVEFVSEFGGIIGLWAGWNIYTLFEIIVFILDVIAIKKHNKKTKRDSSSRSSSSRSSQ